MFPASKTLSALTQTLLSRKRSSRPNNPLVSTPALRNHGPPTTLETVNSDILRLICDELERTDSTVSLRALACCSRALQQVAAPYVFRSYDIFPETDPPEHILIYIRHITVWGNLQSNGAVWMAHLLDSLPSLQAITFIETSCVAWSILETVFARSRITSLTFSRTASFKAARDYPPHDHPPVVTSLTAFVYTPKMWRELANFRKLGGPDDLNAVFSHEAECLASLIPSLRRTIVRLTLPFETAPLRLMAAYHWPKLQELSLFGRYRDEAQVKTLQDLLSSESLTEIQKLSIQVARSAQLDRPFILGHRSAPSTALSGLRSLTVAYPHPDDDLFSIDTSHLHHLSLRDWPRYYTHLGYRNRNRNRWAKPLLSPAECLSILRRMNVSQLTSLELAYLAPSAGFDDELLDYVATSLSNLTSLELHRYREDRSEPVDHLHIVARLIPMKSLRRLRLNLEFHEDHGPYCSEWDVRDAWFTKLTGEIGWEIVETLEKHCPLLQSVELLYHTISTSTWAEFHPCRCADPRFVLDDNEPEREDIEGIRWYRGRRAPFPEVIPPPRCARFAIEP